MNLTSSRHILLGAAAVGKLFLKKREWKNNAIFRDPLRDLFKYKSDRYSKGTKCAQYSEVYEKCTFVKNPAKIRGFIKSFEIKLKIGSQFDLKKQK